jgi:hypothetical protein
MPIVKYKNQSGVVYAYDQTSVYDPVKKQSRPVRKYLGRVDPETGEIISTAGRRGRPPKKEGDEKSASETVEKDYKKLFEDKCREFESLEKKLLKEKQENQKLTERISVLRQSLSDIKNLVAAMEKSL